MPFALVVAGPSRRAAAPGGRNLLAAAESARSARRYRVTSRANQDPQPKRADHFGADQPQSDTLDTAPSSAQPASTGESSSRSGETAWQIPPAWRSQLDPNAPWRKSLLAQRRRWLDQAGQHLTAVGLKLNEVTGYHEVERLKALVGEKETRLKWLREDAKTAKEEYERAVTTRSTTQSDVNSLLERKHIWSDEDVSRFTQLVRSDHTSNQAVSTTSSTLRETELAVDKAFSELMQAILQRYHEEQVWSDKIRNVSTYANLVGLLINLVVFVGAIAFVEPWKRKRLVERLEERIAGMMEHVEGSINGLGDKVGADLASIRAEAQTRNGISPPAVLPTVTDDTLAKTQVEEQGRARILGASSSPVATPQTSILADTLARASPILDKLAPPSYDRDVIFTACVGATTGIGLYVLGMWLGR